MKLTSSILLSALCAGGVLAQAPLYGQCGGQGWSGATTCVSGGCCTASNEWYSQCQPCSEGGGGGNNPPPTTTTKNSDGGNGSGATPTGLTTTLPKSSGATSTSAAIVVSATYDGGMKRFERSPAVCQGQKETGEKDAMFILKAGATLSNVIIGASQAEGIHCQGTCTLNNVWWADVCEDAVTFKQTSGTSYINGGGAFKAEDKIIQFNGRGTVSVKNFFASDYGKVARSCGNCKNNGGPRNFVFENVRARDGGVLCGINTNYGDTCRIANSCQSAGKYCDRYTGNTSGAEPSKVGSGPDGQYCTTSGVSKNC
ncbi:hypothetical protein PG995_015067 [Apiospora arundinis]